MAGGKRGNGDGHAASGAEPTLLVTSGTDDYRLLDSGHGRKLERFGPVTLIRPEEQAIWAPRLSEQAWMRADARFSGALEEEGAGRWERAPNCPEAWEMRHGALRLLGRLTAFRHVGLFPEQAVHFGFMEASLRRVEGRRPSLLNLFGYTGAASLVAAAAGAEVTHVDASRKAIGWARENADLSGLGDAPIRWMLDDAVCFAEREARRGRLYDCVLLDPPKYGRGPKGEVWRLFDGLPGLLRTCRAILRPGGTLILTAYAIRASSLTLREIVAETFGAPLAHGELALEEAGGRLLATSLFCRGEVP